MTAISDITSGTTGTTVVPGSRPSQPIENTGRDDRDDRDDPNHQGGGEKKKSLSGLVERLRARRLSRSGVFNDSVSRHVLSSPLQTFDSATTITPDVVPHVPVVPHCKISGLGGTTNETLSRPSRPRPAHADTADEERQTDGSLSGLVKRLRQQRQAEAPAQEMAESPYARPEMDHGSGRVWGDTTADGSSDAVDPLDLVPRSIGHDAMVAGLLAASRIRPVLVSEAMALTESTPSDPWRAGVAALQHVPCPSDFSTARWRRVQFDAAELLDTWGNEMRRLGWGLLDAFGIDPVAPGAAVQNYGLAALLNGGRVVEMSATEAAIVTTGGVRLVFRRRPMPGAVPLWLV